MSGANLLAWSLQIAAVVGVCGVTAFLLRLRLPAARLLYWQVALLACLALPLVRPWKQEVVTTAVTVSTFAIARPVNAAPSFNVSLEQAALMIIAAGIALRFAWLLLGFWRLRQYRRRSQPLDVANGTTLLISDDIASPVTFGAIRPVVLLPARFPSFDARVREAILCHELLHVQRRDWLCTVAEELVRAVFWFHPAIWWLLGQIQLAREQAVDREVIARTQAREEYVDALLAIAGARPQLDLAPAPLFLRQRHLKQRVVWILKEVQMSKTRLLSSFAAALGVLIAAAWLITGALPLAAAPDSVADAPGISVELGGASLMHRTPVLYPEAARQKGIQGTIILQVKIDNAGSVSDAQVLSGPDELRRAALQSVLSWHFGASAAGTLRQLSISFQSAGPAPPEPPVAVITPRGPGTQPLKTISIVGLSDQAAADLRAQLPVHEGDTFSPAQSAQLAQVVRNFDSHLRANISPDGSAIVIRLAADAPLPPPSPASGTPIPGRIRVGGNVQAAKIINQPAPAYPELAKAARIQGTVRLDAIVAKDGKVQNLTVISGHPLLVPSALQAVTQWVYQPTLMNGEPTEVETEVDVNYTLTE